MSGVYGRCESGGKLKVIHSVSGGGGGGSATPISLSWTAEEDVKANVYFYGAVSSSQNGSDTSQKHSSVLTIKLNDEILVTETKSDTIWMYSANVISFEWENNVEFKKGDVLTVSVTHSGYGYTSNTCTNNKILRIVNPMR